MQGDGVGCVSVTGEFTGDLPVGMNWCFNTWNGALLSRVRQKPWVLCLVDGLLVWGVMGLLWDPLPG